MYRFLHTGIQIIQIPHCLSSSRWKIFHNVCQLHDLSFLFQSRAVDAQTYKTNYYFYFCLSGHFTGNQDFHHVKEFHYFRIKFLKLNFCCNSAFCDSLNRKFGFQGLFLYFYIYLSLCLKLLGCIISIVQKQMTSKRTNLPF